MLASLSKSIWLFSLWILPVHFHVIYSLESHRNHDNNVGEILRKSYCKSEENCEGQIGRTMFSRNKLVKGQLNSTLNNLKMYWYSQRLDHFDPLNTQRWNQRYMKEGKFHRQGGPVLLMINGETPLDYRLIKTGAWYKQAEALHAYMFILEHRFYGESHPTKNLSLENLKFLSIAQALEDMAQFSTAMDQKYNLSGSKWIAIGGSYAGALAAFYRSKFPARVHAVIASSAVVELVVSTNDGYRVVRDSLQLYSPTCVDQISLATRTLKKLITFKRNWGTLMELIKSCTPYDGNQLDAWEIFYQLADIFAGVTQYSGDTIGGTTGLNNITISQICDIMDGPILVPSESVGRNALRKYVSVSDLYYNCTCTNFNMAQTIESYKNESWESPLAIDGSRSWLYQKCNELGIYQSSNSPPFGDFPVEFFYELCYRVFGKKFTKNYIDNAIQKANEYYGGKKLDATRAIFTNGKLDLWHTLGITSRNETNPKNVVILMEGTAHCADLLSVNPQDPPELTRARQTTLEQIRAWLNELSWIDIFCKIVLVCTSN